MSQGKQLNNPSAANSDELDSIFVRKLPGEHRHAKIYIRTIGFALIFVATIQLVFQYDLIWHTLTSPDIQWNATTVLFIIQNLLLPTACVMFWAKKNLGWILATAHLLDSVATSTMTWRLWELPFDDQVSIPELLGKILTVSIYCVLVWMTLNSEVREIYKAGRRAVIIAFCAAAALVTLSYLALQFG